MYLPVSWTLLQRYLSCVRSECYEHGLGFVLLHVPSKPWLGCVAAHVAVLFLCVLSLC